MEKIRISLVQADLKWEDKKANLERFDHTLSEISSCTDVIVLPEMFTTGFTMKPQGLAEPVMGNTMQWMKEKAAQKNAVIAGSLIIDEKGNYFNRLIWMKPDGSFNYYNKRHLFTLSGEQEHYTRGTERKVFEWKGWRFFAQICYDMRFPVFNRYRGDYDCLLFVANWPVIRIDAWEPLAISRAIENQAWLVAVNRVGYDKNGIYHNGCSMAVNPFGKVVAETRDIETVMQVELDPEIMLKARNKLPFIHDKDDFELKL